MGKVKQDKRKPETILRETRRLLKHMRDDRDRCIDDVTTARMEASQYRARATKAEQDAAKWQTRFDTLLLCLQQEVRERIGLKPGIFGGEA
jgi:hypothetical protein